MGAVPLSDLLQPLNLGAVAFTLSISYNITVRSHDNLVALDFADGLVYNWGCMRL